MDSNLNPPLFASLFDFGGTWSAVLVILALCSLVAFTIFIERLLLLRRSEIDVTSFLLKLRKAIKQSNHLEAIELCDQTGGTVPAIVKAGLIRHDRPKEAIEAAMETAGLIEIGKLEKNAKVLSLIAHLSPLIGLLGTVLGFIQAFAEMRLSGMVDISATRIGEAMEYALVTTAFGLVVAIPSIVAYNYIVSRIDTLLLEIQATSSDVVDLLSYGHRELSQVY